MKAFYTKARLWMMGCIAASGLWGSPQVFAAADPELAVTMKTAAFEVADVDNLFTFCIDVDNPAYIYVDCGFGLVEYEVEPSQEGTWIPCTVSPEGTVRIYTDNPGEINYLYCQGGHLTEVDLSKLPHLQILDLSNNSLRKIDLSNNKELRYLDLGANTFEDEPLSIGKLPLLTLLEIENVGNLSPDFNLSDYPELLSFAAFSTYGLTRLDPSGCPKLQRLAVDVTGLSSLDVSKNSDLRILNISDTFITSIDLSKNAMLEQLYVGHSGRYARDYKLSSLDISNNPKLIYLFAQNNGMKSIDISNNPLLSDVNLQDNLLEAFDCSANPLITQLDISGNCLDFATLPLGRTFSNLYYYQQRSMPVAMSYPVGASLDLSKRVLREGTVTEMQLIGVSQSDIREPILLSEDYYDYKEGIISFKREYADSVYACFVNPDFPECVLTTTKFMVKTKEQYGKPVSVLNFSPVAESGSDLAFGLGVSGASPENPRTVFVDFGDGVQVPEQVSCQIPEAPNVKGQRKGYGAVTVYVNDGDNITGLSIDGCELYGIELEKSPTLRSLSLTGTALKYIDLSWQRCLETLTLRGNDFGSLDLTTDIPGYDKNVLNTIDLSSNGLYELNMTAHSGLKHVDLSHNSLTGLDISKAYGLLSLDISYNDFTSLATGDLDELETLNVAGNHLNHIDLPWQNTLRNLDCRDNPLTFASLPCRPGDLEGEYLYAPQNTFGISRRGPSCVLKDAGLEVDGVPTTFVWHREDGSVLNEGSDYVIRNGTVTFKDYSLGKVYCTMTNPVFPELTLMTSTMLVDAPPTNLVAWMDVADDLMASEGHEKFLSLAATEDGVSLYIDWGGEKEAFSEYLLGTTYRLFDLNPVAGRRAGIYTYEDPETLTVFSLSGLPLRAADFSKMTGLNLFAVCYAGCKDMVLPDTDRLESLSLDGNGLSSIDPSRMQHLYTLSAADNNLKSFDLSAFPSLQVVSLGRNGMSEIKVDNPDVWHLDLSGNEFENFSFKGLPALYQVDLSSNCLKSIDIDGPEDLHVLRIESNFLDFGTLPIVPETVTNYFYGNQAHVSAKVNGLTVDLSSQAERDGYFTEFYWCVDEPYFDGEGTLYADLLEPGVDYTIADGVTVFRKEVANVCCFMLNELFPRTFLLTDLMTLTSADVEMAEVVAAAISVDGLTVSISAEEGTNYGVYTTDGKTIAAGSLSGCTVEVNVPAPGIYVVKAGKSSMKLSVK